MALQTAANTPAELPCINKAPTQTVCKGHLQNGAIINTYLCTQTKGAQGNISTLLECNTELSRIPYAFSLCKFGHYRS